MIANADPVEIDGIYYNLITKGLIAEVTTNPNKYSGEVVIPTTVTYEDNNYNVTSIGKNAFHYCSGLTSVTIPNSVTSICEGAFYKCSGITSVTIPNSVTSIEKNAFYACTSLTSVHISDLEAWCSIDFNQFDSNPLSYAHHIYLNGIEIKDLVIPNSMPSIGNNVFSGGSGLTSVTIPNSVTTIGAGAFYDCSGLTSVTIPNSVTSIGEGAFYDCSGLTSVTIPNSVTYIMKDAFSMCSGLTSVTIPNSVTEIRPGVFYGCSSLTSITIPNSVNRIEGYWSYGGAFEFCTSLTSVTIPNSVTSIEERAFKNCSKLSSITIGSGVTSIKEKSFSDCPELTDIYCYAKNVPNTRSDTFEGSYINLATLHVRESSINVYQAAAPWNTFSSIVKIDIPKHTLKYIVDGEDYKSYEIEEGESITAEDAPTKEGYSFSGWSDIPATMPAENVTVTGTFSINNYNLIYKVDGEDYKTVQVEYNASITPEAAPTRDHYTFSGWSEIPETMPAEDITIIGTFSADKFHLIYKVDGVDYKNYEVAYGSAITAEAAPTKEGYSFSGWSSIPATMPAEDITITGTFTICKYNLTYKLDGNVYQTSKVEYGTPLTPIANPSVAAYHTFSGWSEVPATMPAHDVDITGTSVPNKYKLEYKLRDPITGTYSTYKTFEVEYGAAITPEPAPTIEGCTFTGWSTIPATMHSYDVTIYGGLIANYYTLTYQVNGKTLNSLQINYGSTITPLNPTIDGFTFNGWIDLPATMPAHDVTVNASITKKATSDVTYPTDWNMTSWSDETASNLESDPKWSKYDNRYLYNTTCPKGESIELSANGTVIKETAGVEFSVSNCTSIYLENRSGSEDRIDIQVYEPADFFFVLKDLKRGQKISIDFSSSDWHTDNDLFPQPVGAVKMTDSPTTRAIRSKSSIAEYVVSNDGNVRFNVNADKFFYLYNINVTAVSDTYLSYLSNPDGINNQIDCYLYWNGYSSSITGSWGGLYARGADVRIENKSNQITTITRIELYDGTTSLKTVTDQNGNITPGEFKEFTFDVSSNVEMPETLPWMEVYYDVNGASYIKKFVSDIKGSATGINGHRVDDENGENDDIYTIDGKKLSSYPTKKGLYIKNGKKFVVK